MKFKQLLLVAILPLLMPMIISCSDMSSSNSDEENTSEVKMDGDNTSETTVEESNSSPEDDGAKTLGEANAQADTKIAEFEADEAQKAAAREQCNAIQDEALKSECEINIFSQ